MSASWWLILVAVIGGVTVAIQGQFMGVLDRHLGTLESIGLTYIAGGLVITLVLLFIRGGNLGQWQQVPWWALTSGIVGLIIVGSIGYTVPRMGVASAFALIVTAQLIAAALIDHYGLFGAEVRELDLTKASGMALLLLGAWITLR